MQSRLSEQDARARPLSLAQQVKVARDTLDEAVKGAAKISSLLLFVFAEMLMFTPHISHVVVAVH